MKKKVLALTLSAVLALSSTSAFAATTCPNANYNYSDVKYYTINLNNVKSILNKLTVNGKTVDLNSIDWKTILNSKTTQITTTKPVAATTTTKPVTTTTTKPAATQTTTAKPAATQTTTKPAATQSTTKTQTAVTKPATTVNNTASNTTASSSNLTYEQKVVQLVNVERQKAGLPALTLNSAISNIARTKSKDMAANNYFAHQSPTYGSAGDMLTKAGIRWSAWGENIASGQRTPEAVVTAWMNSAGHRANILSSNFSKIGVGYATNASGTPYWTQMFTN